MQIENDGCFVADVKSSKRKETRALFNMHVSLVEVEWYFKAFESQEIMVGGKLSWNVNGMFWVADKTVIFHSTTFWSMVSLGIDENMIWVWFFLAAAQDLWFGISMWLSQSLCPGDHILMSCHI